MAKLMSFFIVLVLIFSIFITVEADSLKESVSLDIKDLEILGILDGDIDGDVGDVTEQSSQKEMDRLTAAIVILKLQGRYDIAKNFESDYNFKDASEVVSEEGKQILSYIRANNMISGNEMKEFKPYEKISEQAYYKILLELLGYKQTTAKQAGDFVWENTVVFAKKIGFNPTGTDQFTVDYLAKATMTALKLKTKTGKIYADLLVEQGRLDKDKAIEIGLYIAPMSKVKSVKAIGNKVIEVVFASDNNKLIALDNTKYSIEGLKIINIDYVNEKTVHLTTAAQVPSKIYSLKVGNINFKFTGISKVLTEPYVTSIKIIAENKITINFNRTLDFLSATNVKNYNLMDSKILGITYNGKSVTLTITPLIKNRYYSIRLSNIKSIDGILVKREMHKVQYKVDEAAPFVKNLVVETNNRVAIYFSESIEKASAENMNNYKVKSAGGELRILKAERFGSKNDGVRITTEPQRSGVRYEITISNISDTAKDMNTIKIPIIKTYFAKKADDSPPVLLINEVEIISRNQIRLILIDDSNINEKTLLNISSYKITAINKEKENIAVKRVQKESNINNKYKILLTTEDLNTNLAYKIEAIGIKDEFENILEEKNEVIIKMRGTLKTPAKIKSYKAINENKVQFTFTKALYKASAEDVSLYTINGNIGIPYYATYSNSRVTLETDAFEEGKEYQLTIEDLEDNFGCSTNLTYNFKSYEEAPTVIDITQIDESSFEIVMSEDVVDITGNSKIYSGGISFTIEIDKNNMSIVKLSTDDNVREGQEYSFDISKALTDKNNIPAKNFNGTKTVLYGDLGDYADIDKPYIIKALAVDPLIVEVEYNEDLSYEGSYSIQYINSDGIVASIAIQSYEIKGSLVLIRLSQENPIEDENSYKLVIENQAEDLENNQSDNEIGEEYEVELGFE